MNDRILFSALLQVFESRLQVTKLAALADEGLEGLDDFLGVGDDEAWWQNESEVSVSSVAAHLVGVAERNSILADSVVNASSGGGVCVQTK